MTDKIKCDCAPMYTCPPCIERAYTSIPLTPGPVTAEEKLGKAILDALNLYCLHHMCIKGDEDEALPLVDALTPPQSRNISKGESEIAYLADSIFNAVMPQIKSAEQAARDDGYTKGCVDAIHNSPMFEEGRRTGQEMMREKAWKIAHFRNCHVFDETGDLCGVSCCEIRAIPIEGEK